MSELRLASEKRLRLFSGRGFPELAEEVAQELGVPITPTSAYDFGRATFQPAPSRRKTSPPWM